MTGASDDLTTINKGFLPTPDDLQEWHRLKDTQGPTFAGSPSWKSFLAFLENGLRKCGLTDIEKDSISHTRWFTAHDRDKGDWSLSIDGKDICVASYWPNSGSTEASGVTAPLIYYDDDNPPASIEEKIVVFDIPLLPDPLPPMFDVYSGFEFVTDDNTHPTDDFSLRQWYHIAYPGLFGGYNDILKNGKARGGLVVSPMGPARAAGVYMLPYESSPLRVPALYLHRIAGAQVREAARKGLTATVKLLAKTEEAETFFLSGFLPGKNYGQESDEIILLLTHTDGPNLTQENGALSILAVMDYFLISLTRNGTGHFFLSSILSTICREDTRLTGLRATLKRHAKL